LSEAGQRMLSGSSEGVDDILSFSKACLDTLDTCARDDWLALKYLNLLRPVYESLKGIQRRQAVKSKTSIHALLHPSEASPPTSPGISNEMHSSNLEVLALVEKLSTLLKDPFGRLQYPPDGSARRISSPDESYSMSWWKQVVS
jgi:hypothetical protein